MVHEILLLKTFKECFSSALDNITAAGAGELVYKFWEDVLRSLAPPNIPWGPPGGSQNLFGDPARLLPGDPSANDGKIVNLDPILTSFQDPEFSEFFAYLPGILPGIPRRGGDTARSSNHTNRAHAFRITVVEH